MALTLTSRISRPAGLKDAIFAALVRVNLKACKSVTIKYDPFRDDVKEIRDFCYHINEPFVINKNIRCPIRTEILNDRSEQTVECDAINGEKFIFKCSNLTALELLHLFNQHVSTLAPPDDTPQLPDKPRKLPLQKVVKL